MPITCWASCLDNCNGVQSREHLVAQAIFQDKAVIVEGLPWCKGAPKTVGLAAVTGKILCQKHNNDFSRLDSAAGSLYDTMRQSLHLSAERKKLMPWVTPKVERLKVDAGRLERWLLKTLINLVFDQSLLIGPTGTEFGKVSRELCELCAGVRPFAGSSGMYVLYHQGMSLQMLDKLTFQPVLENDRVLGAFFVLHGIHMLMWMAPDRPLPPLSGTSSFGKNVVREVSPSKRFERIKVTHGIWPSHCIDFDWSTALVA